MSVIQSLYPAASSFAVTISLASLADDTTNGIAGRASTAIDNSSTLDRDHLVGGHIKVGTSPTAGSLIEIWAYAAESIASGVPTFPDSITGTDAAKTMTSLNVKYAALRLIASLPVDSTSGRSYPFAATSIAALFGALPQFYGLFVMNASGVALDASGASHLIHCQRLQEQVV